MYEMLFVGNSGDQIRDTMSPAELADWLARLMEIGPVRIVVDHTDGTTEVVADGKPFVSVE